MHCFWTIATCDSILLSGSTRLLKQTISRRGLMKLAALGAATAALPRLAKKKRNIEIGHTGITWPNDVFQAITDTGNLGFYGFETFGDVLTKWESQGGLETDSRAASLTAHLRLLHLEPDRLHQAER